MATVLDARRASARETVVLFRTLEALGGRLGGARRVVHCVGDPGRADRDELRALRVSVRTAQAVDDRVPYANKVRMLQAEYARCDHVLAVDNDVAVAADPTPWIGGSRVAAKPAEADVLSLREWELLYAHFGLPMPEARCVTHLQARETAPYFNSGVLVVPARVARDLGTTWERCCRALAAAVLARPRALPFVVPHPPLIEQLALSLTLQALALPVRELPLALNFPTHRPVHPAFGPDDVRPVLLHHHHRLAVDGTLLPCTHTAANVAIARVNATLATVAALRARDD